MCDVGKMFSGGSLGGILGSIGGGLLDVAFPELGIPLTIAAGLGGAGGTFLGDVASGKSAGASILPALETGAIAGATAGLGNVAAGGDFFGAPAASLTGIFGGAAPTDAASAVGAATTPTTAGTSLASAAPTIGGTTTASAAGAPVAGGAGGAVTDIPTTLGPATGATPANLGGSAIGAGGGGTGGGNFLSRGLVGDQGSLISDLTKPTTLLTGGAALLPLLQGNTIPGLAGYQNQATMFNTQGTPLAQSLTTGNLPAGAQSSLDAATRAAKAAVRSQYANMGISGGSQEADALANVDARAATQKVAMLEDLTKIGVQEMGMATPILRDVMQTRLAQDQAQQQAIARLAAALAGSTGTEKTTA